MALDAQSGPAHGRFRNTVTAQAFPLKPTDAFAFGQQRAKLKYDYGTTMADLSLEAARVRAMAKQNAFGIRTESRQMADDISGNANERGIVGSSVHNVNLEKNQAAKVGALMENRYGMDQGLIDIKRAKLDAIAQKRFGLKGLYGAKNALQQEMALGAYGASGSNPYGYGPGGGVASPRLKKAGAY